MSIASLSGAKVAMIIANGFTEHEFADTQRALLKSGAAVKVISPENSLANGWLENGWGHYFPVDEHISDALGSDFDLLVLIGGSRSVAKLASNPHTARLVGHFMDAHKPMAVMNEAIALLALPGKLSGRTISGDKADPKMAATGAVISSESLTTDGNLMTMQSGDVAQLVEATLAHFSSARELVAA